MKKWLGSLAAAFLIFAAAFNLHTRQAEAGVACSVPFNLTNGTTADASQVMANYNALIACLLNAAAAGNNTDITALLGLTTPISPTQGGSTVFIGTTPSASGNTIVISGTTPGSFSYTNGYTVVFLANAANVSTATINVNNQGNVNLFKQSTGGPIALTGGEIATSQIVIATYDGTQFEINPVPNISPGFGLSNNASGTSIQINTNAPPYGFDQPVNLGLSAIASGNLLTVSIVQANGQTPMATSSGPVLIPFRNPTVTTGKPTWVAVTATSSINTNATGATLGTQNNVPFRFWVIAFDNGGTVVPALFNASTFASVATPTSQIFPLDESTLQSSTAISAAATNAGTFYTPNGVTVASVPFKILGYIEYSSGLSTAGTYASGPTKIQLFGPAIKKPGEVLQEIRIASTSATSTANAGFTGLGITQVITPQAAPNLIEEVVSGTGGSGSGNAVFFQLARGSTLIGVPYELDVEPGGAYQNPISMQTIDAPGTTNPTTYGFQGKANGGGSPAAQLPPVGTGVELWLKEIQG